MSDTVVLSFDSELPENEQNLIDEFNSRFSIGDRVVCDLGYRTRIYEVSTKATFLTGLAVFFPKVPLVFSPCL
jgi:hypothetical protein